LVTAATVPLEAIRPIIVDNGYRAIEYSLQVGVRKNTCEMLNTSVLSGKYKPMPVSPGLMA